MTLVGDKRELKLFFDNLMQPLEGDEVYFIYMVARKKWDDNNTLTRSEEMLDMKLLTEYDFGRFYRLLKRFEVPEECYVDIRTGAPIPDKTKGIYIDLVPKSVTRGLSNYFKEFIVDVYESKSDVNRLRRLRKWYRFAMGNIHKANARRRRFTIIDVDDKALIQDVMSLINEHNIPIYWITKTRGGYHIFIENKEWMRDFYRLVYPKLKKWENVEVLKQNQTPICGTYQGGFLVKCWRP